MVELKHGDNLTGKLVEQDSLPVGFLSRWLIGLSLLFVISLLILVYFFYREVRNTIYKKDLSVQNSELLNIKERDEARLTTYEIIDKEKGIYQIPVDEVFNKLVKNPDLLGPIKP